MKDKSIESADEIEELKDEINNHTDLVHTMRSILKPICIGQEQLFELAERVDEKLGYSIGVPKGGSEVDGRLMANQL